MIFLKKSLLLVFLMLINGILYASQEEINVSMGHSIFHEGIGRDGRVIEGTLHGQVPVNGSIVACAGCHGKDAKGGGEAFIRAPNIRWQNLSKPYTARRHGSAGMPYDLESFTRALHTGIAADGRRLDPTMPRMSLADDEVQSLVKYLSLINDSVSTEKYRLVVLGLLPTHGQSSLTDILDAKLRNCQVEAPRNHIAAIDILYYQNPEDAIAKLDKRVLKNPNSIVLMPYLLGWESQYSAASKRWRVPTILPFSFLDLPEGNDWIYRFPGLQTQIKALLKSAKISGRSHLNLVYDPNDNLSAKLAIYSRKLAQQYNFLIDTGGNLGSAKSNGEEYARLWLIPFADDKVDRDLQHHEMMLVPAFFYAPDKVNVQLVKELQLQWRIAYPYAPQGDKRKKWRNPIDVWVGAACEFLIRLGEESMSFDLMSDSNLEWDGDLILSARTNEKEMLDQVFIADQINLDTPVTHSEQ